MRGRIQARSRESKSSVPPPRTGTPEGHSEGSGRGSGSPCLQGTAFLEAQLSAEDGVQTTGLGGRSMTSPSAKGSSQAS